MTQPADFARLFLIVFVLMLAGWWVILRLARPRLRKTFYISMIALLVGFLLASAPTLMLVTGIVWPSLVVILQVAAIGGAIVSFVCFWTCVLLVWRLLARLVDAA